MKKILRAYHGRCSKCKRESITHIPDGRLKSINGSCDPCGRVIRMHRAPQYDKLLAPRSKPKKAEAEAAGGIPVVVDPDYSRFIVKARIIAKQCGYALALHGSAIRDLDVILIPWVEKVDAPVHLVSRISFNTGWLVQRLNGAVAALGEAIADDVSVREHGRLVWTLLAPTHGLATEGPPDPRYIDLSIIPPH